MQAGRELIAQLTETLREAVKWPLESPNFDATIPGKQPGKADAIIRLADNNLMLVEVKSEGYPRDARDSIFHLQDAKQALEGHGSEGRVIPVFVSERITDTSKDLLRRHGVGYFEAGSGSLHLESPSLLIHIDRIPAKPAQRKARSIFTGAREQILLTLFVALPAWKHGDPDDGWRSFSELLVDARTSKSTLSGMLQELEKREVLAVRGEGRGRLWRLSKPGLLLDDWAEAVGSRKEPKSRWHRFEQAPSRLVPSIIDALREHERDIAITGAAAAQLYAPWLTSIDNVDVVIPPGTREEVAKRLQLSKADKGFNVTLIERAGASTMHKQPLPDPSSQPHVLANPFIAYLDTINGPGRNKELAMELRTSVLNV